ncbi:MAG: hypothetical protein M3R15_13810 [Acidobacteriota bacterium]|nr:hypothetical protein [Acidobacteriota bacterium]
MRRLRRRRRVGVEPSFRVIVHVDEAGRDDETARINHARGRRNHDAATWDCRPNAVTSDDDNHIWEWSAP